MYKQFCSTIFLYKGGRERKNNFYSTRMCINNFVPQSSCIKVAEKEKIISQYQNMYQQFCSTIFLYKGGRESLESYHISATCEVLPASSMAASTSMMTPDRHCSTRDAISSTGCSLRRLRWTHKGAHAMTIDNIQHIIINQCWNKLN